MDNIREFETLKDLFNYSIDKYKDNKAFAYIDGLNYTYKEFGEQTNKLNNTLLSSGVGDNEKVAILGQNMPNWPVAYFAAVAFNQHRRVCRHLHGKTRFELCYSSSA